MNPRSTWRWFVVAAGLFAFILLYQRYIRSHPAPAVARVLPGLRASAVTSVQVRPAASLAIRADHTNGVWQLTEPHPYPAQAASVESLLAALEQLRPVTLVTARELQRPNAEEEYGLGTPQATITLQQPDYRALLEVGAKTAPGDQVFLRVVGVVCVADAAFLKYIPRTMDDWRDTALLDWQSFAFDRVAVSNGANVFELQRGTTNSPWLMTRPLKVRADNAKIDDALHKLQSLRVQQFVPEDSRVGLDTYGLQPPQLELGFGLGTNTLTLLQFGKSPTNEERLVYARRMGQDTIVTVANDLLTPWREKASDFRDAHLVSLTTWPAIIEIHVEDNFSVELQTNGIWRVQPGDLPADAELVKDLLLTLNSMRTVQFIDAVIDPDLPGYGLAPPSRRYVLRSSATNSPSGTMTNAIMADLDFGTNSAGQVFARRADESVVYGVTTNDYERLPVVGWQLRERRIWSISTNDVARAIIHQRGKVRQLQRTGPHAWSLLAQGTINDLAVEETVSGLCDLTASAWVARGEQNRARFGFTDQGHVVTLELKNGSKLTVEFGGVAASGCPYATVTLDGTPWIFEFPADLYRQVEGCLTIPATAP